MFTGIIEEKSKIIEVLKGDQSLQILCARPTIFDDLKIGDSIASNGVCLTLEKFNEKTLTFTIGHETLQVTGWTQEQLQNTNLNMERSLKFGDRIHGHMVSGHVDAVTQVTGKEMVGDCLILKFQLPEKQRKEIWKKSSVALNGVSLTVNHVEQDQFDVCLVPETLRKTNLENLEVGDSVNLETDYYMKGLLNSQGVLNAQRA